MRGERGRRRTSFIVYVYEYIYIMYIVSLSYHIVLYRVCIWDRTTSPRDTSLALYCTFNLLWYSSSNNSTNYCSKSCILICLYIWENYIFFFFFQREYNYARNINEVLRYFFKFYLWKLNYLFRYFLGLFNGCRTFCFLIVLEFLRGKFLISCFFFPSLESLFLFRNFFVR